MNWLPFRPDNARDNACIRENFVVCRIVLLQPIQLCGRVLPFNRSIVGYGRWAFILGLSLASALKT